MNKPLISLTLGCMCMLLTIGICIQIRTITGTNQSSIVKTAIENELRDSVLKQKEKYDNEYNKVEKLEEELENLREKATNNLEQSQELQEKLNQYDALLGYTELTGSGVMVTLNDGDSETLSQKIVTDYIVHDGDIIQVVNDLKNAGADAISVNGQRIVNTTGIACIGNVVKINEEKIGAPFEILAIGNPERLKTALEMPGGYIEILRRAGVKAEVEKLNDITVPKFDGVYNFSYMKTVE